ncbi:NADH:flavin oxidoreductase [Ruminococcus sp.]|uniref:NADH:flavin oxidoreductase n=1 Tax=Ruminococcus sp. TaxID=41978 RepID=UPI0025D1A783|nr:NADH:flavin oxidoreductase [Ruminococcus sp.]MBQ8964999.1 NADH:flavin oxidoreductase [Ruminococcus sp.]
MKTIFDKTEINDLNLKNRLFRSATWEALADESGHFDEEIYNIYNELAAGGVGCIISGFTSVSDTDRYFGGMARLSNDGLISEHTRLTDIVHRNDIPIIAQLALGEYQNKEIDELTENDIDTIREMFIKAADRAVLAGYDGVQIHAAHGFFLSRYISPAHNRRADPEQLIIDIANAIRANHPELHITMKINSSDFTFGGLDENGSMRICLACAPYLDSIEVSGNGTSVGGIRPGVNEAYFKKFALALAEKVDIPVILVGGHRSIENMNNVLNEGKIEYLSLSRPLIHEPDLINRWQKGECSPAKCVSCNMCYRTPAHKCIFRLRGIE